MPDKMNKAFVNNPGVSRETPGLFVSCEGASAVSVQAPSPHVWGV